MADSRPAGHNERPLSSGVVLAGQPAMRLCSCVPRPADATASRLDRPLAAPTHAHAGQLHQLAALLCGGCEAAVTLVTSPNRGHASTTAIRAFSRSHVPISSSREPRCIHVAQHPADAKYCFA